MNLRFLYFSKILGRIIVCATGETLGSVYEGGAGIVETYPVVAGITLRSARKGHPLVIPRVAAADADEAISSAATLFL